MSGLEALGIVSNIFQVISFACETLALCKVVYRGRSPDEWLGSCANSLTTLSEDIQKHCQGKQVRGSTEHDLTSLAAQCGIAARALTEEAAFLTSHHAKGSLRGTLQLAVKVNWRKKRLERLEGCLGSYQKTIEAHLLGSICKQSDAIELVQRERFEKLDQRLQYFVSQYASGHTTLSELLEAENCSTRAHIARDTSRTGKAVQSHITSEVNASRVSIIGHVDQKMEQTTRQITNDMERLNTEVITQAQRDRLLASLKFPAINERRNQIVECQEGTFRWVLGQRSVTPDSDNDTKSGSDNSDSNSDSDGGKKTRSFMSTDVADDEDL